MNHTEPNLIARHITKCRICFLKSSNMLDKSIADKTEQIWLVQQELTSAMQTVRATSLLCDGLHQLEH